MQMTKNNRVRKAKMSRFPLYNLFAAAFVASVAAMPAPANAPAWTDTVTTSSRGAYVVGNPDAKAKVVEYASYTCSHCSRFETEDVPGFKIDLVANGSTSLEIRNYVRDPVDLTVSMLARCGGPSQFFDNHRYFMAAQPSLHPRSHKLKAATQALLKEEYPNKDAEWASMKAFMLAAFADMDLASLVKERGMTVPQARTCIADRAGYEAVTAMTDEAASKYGFGGTPSFMINDLPEHDVYDMPTLRARLKAIMQ